MSSGDGHIDADGFSDEPEILVPLSVVVQIIRCELREMVGREVQQAMRRPLMSAAEIAARYDISERHVHGTCQKLGIPKRDEHGHIKKGDGGLTRYSITEWERKRKTSTRTITNQVRRHKVAGRGEI